MRELADRRFVGLLEAAPDAMVCVELDGRIALVNAQAERLFGYPREELVGQPVEILVPEAVRGVHPRHRAGYAADPKPRPMGAGRDLAGQRKDGSTFPAEISLSAIETDEGILVTAAVRDVTERQRAQARFVGLLEAAPDAMVCVELDGRIALVNAQAERLFGYPREELVGQPVEILVPEAVWGVHPRHRAGYAADPKPRPMGAGRDLAGQRKDGSTFPAEISLSAIETDEGILVTAAVRDVTERQEAQAERERLRTQAERDRLERQLQQSQRLESLGQLAGGVAHDFNNLLGVISNYAAFAAEELSTPHRYGASESALADITQIQQAAERAARLTHQLLAFARREVVQPQVLNLNDVATSVLQLLQRTLGEHIELVTGLDPGLVYVLADPGHIEQILVNLAVNARDAMPGGGKLTIETSNVEVDEAYAATHANLLVGRYVTLKVSDNGTGMPPEVADRAFEPFFTTKLKGEGSGLGLATIYGIVTQAGGNVRIYSEPRLGTTITVLLPVTDRQPAHPEPPPSQPAHGSGELVLLVEDEPAMREVTRRILTRNGYQVIAAATGQEAIQAAATSQDRIAALLTDVIMPGMQGREVAEHIREIQPGITVVFMSGYTEGLLSAQRVLEPGINLIEKPFSEKSLLTKLQAMLTEPGPRT